MVAVGPAKTAIAGNPTDCSAGAVDAPRDTIAPAAQVATHTQRGNRMIKKVSPGNPIVYQNF
jgi:hypothetical protein